jgi:hypothetical protein
VNGSGVNRESARLFVNEGWGLADVAAHEVPADDEINFLESRNQRIRPDVLAMHCAAYPAIGVPQRRRFAALRARARATGYEPRDEASLRAVSL